MNDVKTGTLPRPLVFTDDGQVPNSPMPMLLYKGVMNFGDAEPEGVIERVFGRNGWGAMWRNGVYDYLHYHATVHEVLGVARGEARVRFGGDRYGEALELAAGDVAVLPAGTGHQCLQASRDFSVVGAYPPGPPVDITRATAENYRKALVTIPRVPMPPSDPVTGTHGALMRLWADAIEMASKRAR